MAITSVLSRVPISVTRPMEMESALSLGTTRCFSAFKCPVSVSVTRPMESTRGVTLCVNAYRSIKCAAVNKNMQGKMPEKQAEKEKEDDADEKSLVGDRVIGGWEPIKNPNELPVMEIGEFAVAEYNKSSKAALKFVGVVKGQTQVVEGTNYRLDLLAKDGSVTKLYEAIVWDKPWESFRSLTSFKQI